MLQETFFEFPPPLIYILLFCYSVTKLCPTLPLHGLQHTRPRCSSPSPRVCSNSCPLNRWCHPTITSSIVLFSSCLQSFPASGSFPMSQLLASDGQSTRVSASASVLPMNIQSFSFRIDWFDLCAIQGTLKSLLQHQSLKASILQRWAFYMVQLSPPCMTICSHRVTVLYFASICFQVLVSVFVSWSCIYPTTETVCSLLKPSIYPQP